MIQQCHEKVFYNYNFRGNHSWSYFLACNSYFELYYTILDIFSSYVLSLIYSAFFFITSTIYFLSSQTSSLRSLLCLEFFPFNPPDCSKLSSHIFQCSDALAHIQCSLIANVFWHSAKSLSILQQDFCLNCLNLSIYLLPSKLVTIFDRVASMCYYYWAAWRSFWFQASCSSLVCLVILEKMDSFPAFILDSLISQSLTLLLAFNFRD